jgi:hypothetical protein
MIDAPDLYTGVTDTNVAPCIPPWAVLDEPLGIVSSMPVQGSTNAKKFLHRHVPI